MVPPAREGPRSRICEKRAPRIPGEWLERPAVPPQLRLYALAGDGAEHGGDAILGTRAKRPRPAKSTPGVKPRNTPTAERREGPAAEETQRPAEALPLVELRWIVEALRSLRDRTAETADFVARESRHGDPAAARP